MNTDYNVVDQDNDYDDEPTITSDDYANLDAAQASYWDASNSLQEAIEKMDEVQRKVDEAYQSIIDGDQFYDYANFDSGSFDGSSTIGDDNAIWNTRCQIEDLMADMDGRIMRINGEMDAPVVD